jgi:hypothetical protein
MKHIKLKISTGDTRNQYENLQILPTPTALKLKYRTNQCLTTLRMRCTDYLQKIEIAKNRDEKILLEVS